MATNFRKTKSLGKGVNLTVSKSGPSISFGKKGARVTINKNGVRGRLSVPGSGLSYTKQKSFPKGSKIKKVAGIVATVALIFVVIYVYS